MTIVEVIGGIIGVALATLLGYHLSNRYPAYRRFSSRFTLFFRRGCLFVGGLWLFVLIAAIIVTSCFF